MELLDRAIALDPENDLALGLGAFCRVFLVTSAWSDDPAEQLSQARELVSRALNVSADDPEVLALVAIATGLARDLETAVALADRAVELNPGSSYAPHTLAQQGLARCAEGRFGEAVALLKQAVKQLPDFLWAYVCLAASFGHLGDRTAGREAIARFRSRTPADMRTFAAGYRDPGVRKLFLEGIELAEADEA